MSKWRRKSSVATGLWNEISDGSKHQVEHVFKAIPNNVENTSAQLLQDATLSAQDIIHTMAYEAMKYVILHWF